MIFTNPWPWYFSGVIIGSFVPLFFLLGGKVFGISASLRHICALWPHQKIRHFVYNWKEEGKWNLYFVFGIVIGGQLANLLVDGQVIVNISDETKKSLSAFGLTDFTGLVPAEIFNWDYLITIPGIIQLVIGGVLIGFGTRYARGCTSGHAISGLSNLQLSSLIAVVGFFSGGLVATHLLLPLVLG